MQHSNAKKSALIVTNIKQWADALSAILLTTDQISQVDHAGDYQTAMALLENSESLSLVLIDFSLTGDEAFYLFTNIKKRWPKLHCIALIERSLETQIIQEMEGIHGILYKGFSIYQLTQTINDLLPFPNGM